MPIWERIGEYLRNLGIYSTTIDVGDVIEILIIAILLYYLLRWTKTTRAWSLLKGIIVIAVFLLIAFFANMDTILWIAKNVLNYAVFALLIVLQPELRKGLENLGRKNFIGNIISTGVHRETESITTESINEIVKACTEMGKARTGALIVMQKKEGLDEYESTGIKVDAVVTSALLINIFEKNTPLHDGAVIINGNRVVSATCYLPLSDSMSLSKDLGTRHRAAVGLSERSDALTIVVSEETGRISVTLDGKVQPISGSESLRDVITSYLVKSEKKTKTRSKAKIKNRKDAKQPDYVRRYEAEKKKELEEIKNNTRSVKGDTNEES